MPVAELKTLLLRLSVARDWVSGRSHRRTGRWAKHACAGLFFVGTIGTSLAWGQIVADEADDICGPAVDPCVITQRIDIQQGANIDFGLRLVVVEGNGDLNFDANTATLSAGGFTLGGKGVDAEGADDFSGNPSFLAVRGCELDETATCTDVRDCGLGTCTSFCTDQTSRPCGQDSDCFAGTCTVGPACSRARQRSCTVDADCDLGECSIGTGDLSVDSPIQGDGEFPANVSISAAGDVSINAPIDLNRANEESDGGGLTVFAAGNVTVNDKVSAFAGRFGFGGEVFLEAGGDVIVAAELDLNGGDADGGTAELVAGRDVIVQRAISVNAVQGEGFGGLIDISSGRDVVITGPGASNRTVFGADGHKADGFAGDGGELTIFSERDILIGPFVTISVDAATPDGFGGEVSMTALRDIEIDDGDIDARGPGIDGAGGAVDLTADGTLTVSTATKIDLTGGFSDGGSFDVSAFDMEFSGEVDLRSLRGGGDGGDADLGAVNSAVFGGELRSNGIAASFDLSACRVELLPTAYFRNQSEAGDNRIFVGESLRMFSGAKLEADATEGTNQVFYRDEFKPPLLQGSITPAVTLVVNPDLPGCAVCGNFEVDTGETCDDGDTDSGDGCSTDCQLESCIAETPGYPDVPLCDDASACTEDICNRFSGACDHPLTCADTTDCTVESCVDDVCVSTPTNSLCADDSLCNGEELCVRDVGCQPAIGPLDCSDGLGCTEDSCTEETGCVNNPNHASCSDGVFCNSVEFCDAENGCSPGNFPTCDDGVFCTDDACDVESDQCESTPNDLRCDDGKPCTVDFCDSVLGCSHQLIPACAATSTTTTTTSTTTLPRPPVCGDADGDGEIFASDALIALQTTVGADDCPLAICDVNSDGRLVATDALTILNFAVQTPGTVLVCNLLTTTTLFVSTTSTSTSSSTSTTLEAPTTTTTTTSTTTTPTTSSTLP